MKQMACKNCTHKIKKDNDSYGGFKHLKERPKYIGAPSTCWYPVGRYREKCGCGNAKPLQEKVKS